MNPQDPLAPTGRPPAPAPQPTDPALQPPAPTLTSDVPAAPTPAGLDPQQTTAATPPVQNGVNPAAMPSDPSQISHPQNKLPFIVGVAVVSIGLIVVIALLAL